MKEKLKALLSFKSKRLTISVIGVSLALALGFALMPNSDKPMIDENLPALDTQRDLGDKSPKLPAIIQIYRKGHFYCTAFVIGNNYALTASHCLINDEWDGRTKDDIEVILNNKATGIIAKAVGIDVRRDIGLLKGDFRGFDLLNIDNDEPGLNGSLMTCGFPGGNKHLLCTSFSLWMNDGFALKGMGFLQPGMSGGPVINIELHKVVGINVVAYPAIENHGGVGITSLCGVLGDFNIEP